MLYMIHTINKWKTQIRKGYIELCVLILIEKKGRLYGFEILDLLKKVDLLVKEGTLYPLLNRMTTDKLLSSVWETKNVSGHPRKFYSLTNKGKDVVDQMKTEFLHLFEVYNSLNKET